MRSKYGTYPEYHTSLDNLNLVTQAGLVQSFDTLKACLEVIEANRIWCSTVHGEPQLGKRGLYPTLSKVGSASQIVRDRMNFLAHCDGRTDLIDIAQRIGVSASQCREIAQLFFEHGLIEEM